MRVLHMRHSKYWNCIFTVIVLLGFGLDTPETFAVPTSSNALITACANKKTRVLRHSRNGKCRRSEIKLEWNQQGPQGTQGPQGEIGATGPAGRDPTPVPLTCATGGECEIGDVGPGGGTVFYDHGSRQTWGRYLEAAPVGWYDGLSSDPTLGWCASSEDWANDTITTLVAGGASGTAIGDGWANSVRIVRHCPHGAAAAARMYRGGAKNDWYLPAQDELVELYEQRTIVTGLGETNRWSSTETDATTAWRKYFNAAGGDSGLKQFDNAVRPIRAF